MTQKIALVGMPNVGKTALFNRLTGSFQKVANFPGVTVEKKSGWISDHGNKIIEVIDLPGIYSLDATTLDEKVTKDFLMQKEKEPLADLFVLVLDATNLDKSLFLALQLKNLGYPLMIALNLSDEARKRHLKIDLGKFANALGAEVVETSASTGEGIPELILKVKARLLSGKKINIQLPENTQKTFRTNAYVNGIFKDIDLLLKKVVLSPLAPDSFTEKIDRFLLNPIMGPIILFVVLLLMFQTLFAWAQPLMDGIEAIFQFLGEHAAQYIGHHLLRSFIVDGVINGVGGVLVFLPQILLLFLFIQFLEDLGYLGRAAFLMDSLMRRIGLPGKSVIPLLSSHACAIPGILSTRVIDNRKERLITMLVIPLTTCSARLPVYALLIGAMIPNNTVGILGLKLQGIVLFGLYILGFASALIVAMVLKKTLPASSPSMLLMELPPYRIPKIRNLATSLLNKARIFLKKAGGTILLLSIAIWFLVTFPQQENGPAIEHSYAATLGRAMEPVFRPLGFDWRITTALVPTILAREVMVSSLSLVLSIKDGSKGFETDLASILSHQFELGTLIALLVWFVFAPQCVSTFAVMKRESGSYKWPVIMVLYTLAMAYFFAWVSRMLITSF
jgi:ferrous iron transport protein B